MWAGVQPYNRSRNENQPRISGCTIYQLLCTFKPMSKAFVVGLAAALLACSAGISSVQAGIFDLPSFIEPGSYSVGIEPEVAISNGTGAALNLKPRIGHTDLLNWEGMIGFGAGARKFRVGLNADFEWFPDIEKQPGIATALFTEYYRIDGGGQFVFGLKPMVYKTFPGAQAEYTPFVALPIGWNVRDSNLNGWVQIALGCNFKVPGEEHWRFTGEVGFNVSSAYSYISGGVTYFQ